MTIDTETGKEAPAELSSQRVQSIFSEIATKYERFNAVSSFGTYKRWLSGMMKFAPISEEDHVLDVAGGTGDVTFAVARAKHPAHIELTDFVPEMLEVAKTNLAKGKGCGVDITTRVVDAQDMPYCDGGFDAVTMAYGIRNMPDRPKALSEIYRVLKPGGHLICLEFSTPNNRVWRGLYSVYLKHIIPFWGGVITGHRDDFVYLSRSIKAFPDQPAFAAMLREAGFVDISWHNFTGGIAAVHIGRKPTDVFIPSEEPSFSETGSTTQSHQTVESNPTIEQNSTVGSNPTTLLN